MTTIYALFDCDEWRSTSSINATNPIIVTNNDYTIAKTLFEKIQESTTIEEYNQFKNYNANQLFEACENQQIPYLHLIKYNITN